MGYIQIIKLIIFAFAFLILGKMIYDIVKDKKLLKKDKIMFTTIVFTLIGSNIYILVSSVIQLFK